MSYVDLKHLLAELALETMRRPADAARAAVISAYAELASNEHPWVEMAECLTRAGILARQHGWTPSAAEIRHLIERGLLSERPEETPGDGPAARDDRIALSARFLPHLGYLQRHAPRLLSALGELRDHAGGPETSPDIAVGAALFNAGLFFECHEWFEGLWKGTGGPEKGFYHGIVQAAAAFYHYEKGNRHGCRTLMRKGRQRLVAYPGHYLGVDLAGFEDALAQWAEHFEGRPRPAALPRIEIGQLRGSQEKN